MKILIISKQDVEELLSIEELINSITDGYVKYSQDKVKAHKTSLQVNDTAVVVSAPGYLAGDEMMTVKVNAKNSSNYAQGLPFLMGTILLLDSKTGRLLAVFESSLITAMRTGAAGAVGVKVLTDKNANKVALIGAGMQGEWQIRAINCLRKIEYLTIYDIKKENAIKLANTLQRELGIKVSVSDSIQSSVALSDIVITVTQSKEPLIKSSMLHNNLFINAFGADQPGKVEIDKEVILKSYVVVDDKNIAFSDGVLNAQFRPDDVQIIEIGELLANPDLKPRDSMIKIFGNAGLAFQDLIACKLIYDKALKLNKGVWVDMDSSLNHVVSHENIIKSKL